jgi:3'-phosphoadenosine 5'-phosphosulfate sulfotransferase (PAPS reductase)/FAD synthetase
LSGGKDSTCLALALNEREPRDYEYTFTPTGDELPELYAHLARVEDLLGKPIRRLSCGKTLDEVIEENGMLPNFRARFCTRILKIEPTIEYMASLPPGSIMYVGLRADEGERIGIYGDDVKCDFPFRRWGWGVKDVWAYLERRGVSIPRRTDCGKCYHQRISEWRNLWRDHPERFTAAADMEQRMGHTFRSPGRDTWPVKLVDMGKEFARGRPIRGDGKEGEVCRVCSL